MTNAAETEVHELTQDDVEAFAQQALDEAELTIDELREQAELGRFDSETARHAWFVLKGLGQA